MSANVIETDGAPQRVEEFARRVRTIRSSLHEVVVGQDEVIDQLLVCALTGSHALLVGVPGLAKTLMVKALAAAFHWKYARIQFTPDLMPADVTGYELLGRSEDSQGPKMVFRPGPVFANLVLADEINRAAPRRNRRCWSRWPSITSPWAVRPICWRSRSWWRPRRTPSSRKGHIRCPRRNWIAS